MMLPAPEKVRRIAVLRANALGDFIVALPALDALRTTYPWAEIVLLGKAWHRDFLRDRAGPVDRVEVAPLHEPHLQPDFFHAMQERRFDIALQLHGSGRMSNAFVRQLGARCTAGWCGADAPALDLCQRYDAMHPAVHHLLEAVALVGARTGQHAPHLALRAADRAAAARALSRHGGPLVVLQPGASDPRRRWPGAHCAALGDALAALGLTIAVHGSADETALVHDIVGRMRAPALALAGTLDLGGLAGVLACARLVVGSDSGPLHLARAVGTPTVVVMWIGNLHPWGPVASHKHRVALSWQLECPVCGLANISQRCHHDASFVAAVSVAEVLTLCHDTLVLAAGTTQS